MKTMHMYSRGLLVGTIFLMGNALQPAAHGGGEGRSVASSASSRTATVSMRSFGRGAPGSVPTLTRPSESVKVEVPDQGMLFYVPYSQAEPFPWVATNRDLLKLAIEKSQLGSVPELAPNAYYVSDEWAEMLKRDGGGRFASLYYVVEGEAFSALRTASKQELIREVIKSSGYCHVPKQAANVFMVTEEWRKALQSAGCEVVTLSQYVVKGDMARKIVYVAAEERDLLSQAIVEEGSEHVVGLDESVFYISALNHRNISEQYERRTYVHPVVGFLRELKAALSRGGGSAVDLPASWDSWK